MEQPDADLRLVLGATGAGAVNADGVEQARALGERVARVASRLVKRRDKSDR